MTEGERGPGELPDELRAYVRADEVPAVPGDRRARILKRLELDITSPGGGSPSPAAPAAPRSRGAPSALRTAATFVAGALTGAAITWAMTSSGVVRPPSAATPETASQSSLRLPPVEAPDAPEASASPPRVEIAPSVELPRDEVRRTARRPATPRRAEEPSSLAAELRLLDAARATLAASNPDAARAALTRHALEFPEGQLAAEREQLRARLPAP